MVAIKTSQMQVMCGMDLDERYGEHDQGRGGDRYLLVMLSLCVLIMFNVIFVLVLPALSK